MPYSSADPNAFLAIGMQSALGTPQTSLAKLRFAKYLSGTGVQPQLEIVHLREGGDGLDFGFSYKKSQKVGGQIVVNARPEIVGQLLQLLPGGATWDGASGPAVHAFHTGHASFPWATLLAQHPGSSLPHLISDVRFTGFTLEGNAGEPWKLTYPFVGINHGASFNPNIGVPSYTQEDPFLFQGAPTYVLDGTADSDITGFKIEQGLGVEELQSQAVTLDEIVVQNRDTTVEIHRRYEAPALWKKIVMGAGVTPTTTVATGAFRADSAYGAGAALSKLSLQTPLLAYESIDIGELDPDGKTVVEVVTAKALRGATHALFAQLTNAHASAYAS